MRRLVLMVAWGLLLPSCIPGSGAQAAPEGPSRTDRRVARENRALRREVRALRDELAKARGLAESEIDARHREGEIQTSIVAGLAQQIEVLARTIGELETAMRAQSRVEAPAPPTTKNAGPFSKLRVGSVPTSSPTLPEPRGNMDQPDRSPHLPDATDPFSKAPNIPPRPAP